MTVETVASAALARSGRLQHGFFTRRGGVSDGIYASLNCGYGSDDSGAAVTENRARVAGAMRVATPAVLTVHQYHSAETVTAREPWLPAAAPKADALVTDRAGLALSILTADCAPVLLADAEAGVIGAAHAGWRGALTGILESVIAAMQTLGARREAIAAAVGPCIAQPSYEVGAEFRAAFTDAAAGNAGYFQPSDRAGHFRFDLPGYVGDRLRANELGEVEVLGIDTYAEADDFFSYRRTTHRGEPDYGRQISVISLTD
tara:strand:+ start:448 stop:1227 length:780 start_codon:yes stop_codon:yes gene_type:complete